MIDVLLSIPIAIIWIELALRVFGREKFRNELKEIIVLLHHFRMAVTDDERQRHILSSAIKTLKQSLVLLGWITFFGLIVFAVPLIFGFDQTQYLIYFISMSVVGSLWVFFRNWRWYFSSRPSINESAGASNNRYNYIDRWLHWFALKPTLVRRMSFDLDRAFAAPSRSMTRSCQSAYMFVV